MNNFSYTGWGDSANIDFRSTIKKKSTKKQNKQNKQNKQQQPTIGDWVSDEYDIKFLTRRTNTVYTELVNSINKINMFCL